MVESRRKSRAQVTRLDIGGLAEPLEHPGEPKRVASSSARYPPRHTMITNLAYIDPGTGSLVLQMIAGGVAAVAVTAKLYWRRVRRVLRLSPPEDEGTPH